LLQENATSINNGEGEISQINSSSPVPKPKLSDPPKDVVKKQTRESVWSNLKKLFALKPVFYNTLILCTIWASAAFTFYFVEFYTKFVPTTNIYLLQVVIGCADVIASFVFYFCL